MKIQYVLEDQTAAVRYEVHSNTPVSREDALYLVEKGFFEESRKAVGGAGQAAHELVKITPPDSWHKPTSSVGLEMGAEEILISASDCWLSHRRGQVSWAR